MNQISEVVTTLEHYNVAVRDTLEYCIRKDSYDPKLYQEKKRSILIEVDQHTPLKDIIDHSGENGEKLPCTVIAVDDKFVTIDQNHPLAGHDLTFEVEILKIEDAPEDFVSEAERRKERERLTGMLSNGF